MKEAQLSSTGFVGHCSLVKTQLHLLPSSGSMISPLLRLLSDYWPTCSTTSWSEVGELSCGRDPEYFKASMSDAELKSNLSRFFEDVRSGCCSREAMAQDFGNPVPPRTFDRALQDPEKLYSLVLVVAAKCPRHEE